MRNVLEILTPENVHVEYEVAGLGSRFIALFIDSIIQMLMLAIISVIIIVGESGAVENFVADAVLGTINSIVVTISLIVLFLILFGYYIFFEMVLKGQSPGKKIMKLRVIKQTGEPINILDSFMRNFFRIVYMVPLLHLLEALLVVLSKNYKRIGDFAANTIVVKIRKDEKLVTIEDVLESTYVNDKQEEAVNIFPVTNSEYAVLKEFLERKDNLGSRTSVLTYKLNRYFSDKFNLAETSSNPISFFEEIVRRNSGL
ncbi:MAG: RDD family protein [Clostridiaceae bacterium]|nr:RDD family protein [Clostridiaceae bacterium]